MARMNTLLRIAPPASGATIPWAWNYSPIGPGQLPDNPLYVQPVMVDTEGNTELARDSVGQTYSPNNVLDLFRGNPDETVRRASARQLRTVVAPANEISVSQMDKNNRDANLLLEANDFPYTLTLTLRKSSTISLTVTFQATAVTTSTSGADTFYDISVTYQSIESTGIPGVQRDSYFDEDDAILAIPETVIEPFDIFGEIFQSDSAFDISLGDDGTVQASATADVRVRYDARIVAGLTATFDGDTYRIVTVEVEDRRRFLRLSLSRVIES